MCNAVRWWFGFLINDYHLFLRQTYKGFSPLNYLLDEVCKLFDKIKKIRLVEEKRAFVYCHKNSFTSSSRRSGEIMGEFDLRILIANLLFVISQDKHFPCSEIVNSLLLLLSCSAIFRQRRNAFHFTILR